MTKVLLITYYWPPAGGPGVQRWLSFVKYLPEFEIEPIVLVPQDASYPIIDASLLSDVPQGVSIRKLKIREPYSLARIILGKKAKEMSSGILREEKSSLLERLALWIRGNFYIPDARKAWVKPAIHMASQIIRDEDIQTVITTGPPHSVHLIGLGLKKQLGLNWIADFRDPWTSIGYHSKLKLTSSSKKKHKMLESQVLNTADKIITTSKNTAVEFSRITSKPTAAITNGFEPSKDKHGSGLDEKFSLSYIGSLLSGRNPVNLWKSLAQLVKDKEGFSSALEIKLIGVVSEEVLTSIQNNGLKEYTTLIPYVEHQRAIELQRQSQILLLLEIDKEETRGIIPGKLFEYMAAKRPVLAIGPDNWEAGEMVVQNGIGCYFQSNEKNAIKDQLLEWFSYYEKSALNVENVSLEKYTRRELTKILAEEIRWV